jgi:hypothetical protein
MVRNLRCLCDVRELKIKGSLWIFNKGNNLCSFEFKDIKPTIEELEDILQLNLSLGGIKYLEIAKNIIVSNKCDIYLREMGELARKRKRIETHGIYYKGGTNEFAMYDKGRDVKRRSKKLFNLPESLLNQNILRPELRLWGRSLKNITGGKNVEVKDLYDPIFFSKCQDHLINQYFKITKIGQFYMSDIPTTPSILTKLLADISLQNPKLKISLKNQILYGYQRKSIKKKNKERMLSILAKPIQFSNNYKKSGFIEELDKIFADMIANRNNEIESLRPNKLLQNILVSFSKTDEVL